MQVHVFYTEAHAQMFRKYFLGSLGDTISELQIVEHHYVPKFAGRGDFLAPDFLDIINAKMQRVCRSILDSFGQIIIWSDVDIQFFVSGDALTQEAARQLGDCDIAFQNEGDGTCNTGFVVMRCNQKTLALFAHVSALCVSRGLNEQPLMWEVLNGPLPQALGLRWTLLSNHFWAFTHGRLYGGIYLHHANNTVPREGKSSLELKYEQFEYIKELLQRQRLNPSNILWCLSRSDGVMLSPSLRLLGDGHIEGGTDPTESHWHIEDNNIIFCRDDGTATVRFAVEMSPEGKLRANGRYVSQTASEFHPILAEVSRLES